MAPQSKKTGKVTATVRQKRVVPPPSKTVAPAPVRIIAPAPSKIAAAIRPKVRARNSADGTSGRLNGSQQITKKVQDIALAQFAGLYRLAKQKAIKGEHREAIGVLVRALKINPKSAEAFLSLGNALQSIKQYEDALASYDKALSINPNFVEALCNRGVALQRLNRAQDALESYEKALTIQPGHVQATKNRGVLLKVMKGPESKKGNR